MSTSEGELEMKRELRELAQEAAKTMGCNCDLDNWEPERTTGHSHVCRIHKHAVTKWRQSKHLGT